MVDIDMGTIKQRLRYPTENARGKIGAPSVKRLSVLTALLLAIFSENLPAQDAEQVIKAAFIRHFCSYVQWPKLHSRDQSPHLVVGVAASHTTTRIVRKTLESKQSKSCRLSVQQIQPEDDLQNIHILYLARSAEFDLEKLAGLARDLPILIITEDRDAPELAVINFVTHNDSVRFEISKSRADETGLKLSSELLSVAVKVR